MTQISNCGHDENGRYVGGIPGDQGGEYQVINWYRRPWNCVLRYPDRKIAEEIARISRAAAMNQCIGYSQPRRMTYINALRSAGWNPEKVMTPCEGDCSSTTLANIIAAGHRMGISALQMVNPNGWTGNMRAALRQAGFIVFTDPKYLTSSDYLLPGDILLNDRAHVAVNLTAGSKAGSSPQPSAPAPVERPAQAAGSPVYMIGKVYTTAVILNVRTGPGTQYSKKSYSQLTPDGKKHSSRKNGELDAGTRTTCLEVAQRGNDIWIRTPSGWLAAYYAGKMYVK